MARRLAILLVALALAFATGGCTAIAAHVDDYTFDVDPCPRRAPSCTGGRTLAFAVRSADTPAELPAGHRDGFDLDGTDAVICGQPDFVGYDESRGIDNGMAPIFELYEGLAHVDLRLVTEQQAAQGMTGLIVVEHVDDTGDDDCVEVTRRDAVLPDGVAVADLDRDGDGLLDANLTFDYRTSTDRDSSACVIDGVLHARFPSENAVLPGVNIEGTVDRPRFRMQLDGTGEVHQGLAGGSVRVDDLVGGLPDAVVEFIRLHADLDPSTREARDCSSISFGQTIDMVSCELGVLRSMP